MAGKCVYLFAIAFCMVAVDKLASAAPPSVAIASAGDTGAFSSAGTDDSGAYAGSNAGTVGSGAGGGGSGSLLSRSGPSPSKGQSIGMVSGPNGDTTILQQSGDQSPKVYKISGNSG